MPRSNDFYPTITTLRNVIGGITLEDALTSRDHINGQLRIVFDEASGKWGIRVNRVELKSIDPPDTIQQAMEKQMRAERDRRAAILNAEGVKQAQILTAEGERQSVVLRAQGARESAILRADGEAQAIGTVFSGRPRRPTGPSTAVLSVPPDAPASCPGRGQQTVSDPVGVLAGLQRLAARARAGGLQYGSSRTGCLAPSRPTRNGTEPDAA
jgi:SPFH domain / Band 7 family